MQIGERVKMVQINAAGQEVTWWTNAPSDIEKLQAKYADASIFNQNHMKWCSKVGDWVKK